MDKNEGIGHQFKIESFVGASWAYNDFLHQQWPSQWQRYFTINKYNLRC